MTKRRMELKRREGFETKKRRWWSILVCSKRSKIAVCPSAVNNWRWVLTCSHSCLRIFKCDLEEIYQNKRQLVYVWNQMKVGISKEQANMQTLGLTKPQPLDLPVFLSVITTASRISPNCSKYLLIVSLRVSQASPPTKILVNVVSLYCPPTIWNCLC